MEGSAKKIQRNYQEPLHNRSRHGIQEIIDQITSRSLRYCNNYCPARRNGGGCKVGAKLFTSKCTNQLGKEKMSAVNASGPERLIQAIKRQIERNGKMSDAKRALEAKKGKEQYV